MPVEANRIRFLRSLAAELDSQSNRVRDLIGSKHWLSDGHHKEYLLLSVLSRYLPAGIIAARGFVVSAIDESICSKEQDILFVDTLYDAPIFNQSQMIIAFPKQIVGCISVKTTLGKKEVCDSIAGHASVEEIVTREATEQPVWYGTYFFSGTDAENKRPELIYDYISAGVSGVENSTRGVGSVTGCADILACGGALAVKLTKSDRHPIDSYLNGFTCGGFATALFLGHLLDHISALRELHQSQLLASLDQLPFHPFAEHKRKL